MNTSTVHTGPADAMYAGMVSTSSEHGKQDLPRGDSEFVGDHKRVFVCLNGTVADVLRLKAAGILYIEFVSVAA